MYVKAVHGLALGLSGTTLPEYTNEVTASTSTHARTKFDHVCQANVSGSSSELRRPSSTRSKCYCGHGVSFRVPPA